MAQLIVPHEKPWVVSLSTFILFFFINHFSVKFPENNTVDRLIQKSIARLGLMFSLDLTPVEALIMKRHELNELNEWGGQD